MVLGQAQFVGFLPSSDLERSRAFFEGLGLAFVSGSPHHNVHDANGTPLWVTAVEELAPQAFTVAGWEVPDIDPAVTALVAAGVHPKVYDGMGQDDRGVWTAPSGTKVIWFSDPDGNNLSISQS
jgi:catechol 2,3-dioxygenase-like lactoylglutathione lyase family enzyme